MRERRMGRAPWIYSCERSETGSVGEKADVLLLELSDCFELLSR